MTVSGTNLSTLSDSELIKFFRKEQSKSEKDKVFNFLLFRQRADGKSWHKNILTHVNKEVRKFAFCSFIDKDDLYQVVVKKFYETVVNNFDVDSSFCFSTYVWWAIQSSINRIIQEFKTKKRISEMRHENCVNIDEVYEKNKKFEDVISQDGSFGSLKTLHKATSYDDVLFYRELIGRIKEYLTKEEDIYIDAMLKRELIYLIKNNEDNNYYLNEISERYNVPIDELRKMLDVLQDNLEKRLFSDLINLYEHGIKDDEVLTFKYKCPKIFINKTRKMMSKKIKEKITGELNFSIEEIFN
jgi:uncharacterized protein (DUF2164 family)